MLIRFSAFVTENQLKLEKAKIGRRTKHFPTTEQERSQVKPMWLRPRRQLTSSGAPAVLASGL